MPETTTQSDWQNPWVWTVAALVVGVALFVNFAPNATHETKPTNWALEAGRTGAADNVPSSTAVPDQLKGKYR